MTSKNTYNAVSKLLEEDRHVISYRPSWKEITGSVNATILLQQVKFRWESKKGQRFYKFFTPPKTKNPAYKPGDSWTEELGFTLSELQGAIKKIGKRLSKNDLSNLPEAMDGYFFGYFRDQQHLTWHYFNEEYFMQKVLEHYGFIEKPESPDDNFPSGKNPSSQIGNSNLAKSEIPISILTENTTETTTDNLEASPQLPLLKENPPTDSDSPNDSGSPSPEVIPAAPAAKSAAPNPAAPTGPTPGQQPQPGQPPAPAKNGSDPDNQADPPDKEPRQKTERETHMDTYMDTFIQETGIPLPTGKKSSGWWWGRIGEYYAIFTQADKTQDQGIAIIKEAVQRLRKDNLTISDPNSLIKTIRAIIGEQNTKAKTRLPSGLTPEQLEAYRKRQAETAREAWKPD